MYKPERPDWADALIRKYTKAKMPYFFTEAKGYEKNQVVNINKSLVNKIRSIVKKKQLNFRYMDGFDYHKFMTNPDCGLIDSALFDKYDELSMTYHNRINNEDADEKHQDNVPYIIADVKADLMKFGHSEEDTADMLIQYLYNKDTEAKMLLWGCFGEIMLKNLKHRINPRETYCKKCGSRFIPRANAHKYCDSCFLERARKPDERIVSCKDCGKLFVVPKSIRNKKRCDVCQHEEEKRRDREKKRRKRLKNQQENEIIYCD